MSGFFGVVSRYARPSLADQRENRLTQVFAGVLEHSDGLAVELARDWLRLRPGDSQNDVATQWQDAAATLADGDIRLRHLRTQRPTYSGKLVDLELRFGHPNAPRADDTVVWVEVKHGASPHEHQLSNYLRDIERLSVRASAVVLLAPRQSYPFETPAPPPPRVLQRRWQHTAARCARWGRRIDGVPRFLVDELLDYLQEENLMDLEVISPLHLVALAEYPRAVEGIKTVCEVASSYIDREWATRADYNKHYGRPSYGVGYWETHPHAKRGEEPADWGPVWWDWNLRESDLGIEDSRGGVPTFTCGLTADLDHPIVTTDTSAWAIKLSEADGFTEFVEYYRRFDRVAYPEEVLVGRTIQTQGEALGRWVVETYVALSEAGPPRRL